MKRDYRNALIAIPVLLMVLIVSPGSARADYTYTFSGLDVENLNAQGLPAPVTFSFTEPSLITTDGPFDVSFTIEGTTFLSGFYTAFNLRPGFDCFAFSTNAGPLTSCPTFVDTGFAGFFPGATTLGTFEGEPLGCTQTSAAAPCVFATSVTITPEPSSVALLGSGLLGVAAVMRRKWPG